MKRIGILTAGGDTPALNATIHGAVTRANQLQIELYGFIKIEVMGRHAGYLALASAYGRPDIVLVPEHALDLERLVERVKLIYDLQKNVVIVCGEGIVDDQGRDCWGLIHPRQMHPMLYDPHLMKPSKLGMDYLAPIFTDAIGADDMEHMRQTLFARGDLSQPYHSINTDVHKRIRFLEEEAGA